MSLKTVAKKIMYEGMFLVDSARAGADWDGIIATIKKILERAEAEIVSIRKWDDRRLAYEIRHVNRGTYILTYFRADGQHIQGIEKAVQLSEKILRVLILNAEHMTEEDMEKDTPAIKAEKEERKPGPAKEPTQEDEAESPDDRQDTPTAREASGELEEPETEKEIGTQEDTERADEIEQTDQTERAERPEEQSQSKSMADD
jgi:small subunit ribosomal protein S6